AKIPAIVESETQILQAVEQALDEHVKLLVIDHITSPTAVIFPVAHLVKIAHARGVPVFVDGAHAPGHLRLDVGAIGADWYTGNAHKWFFAPKGCAVLWSAPEWRDKTHPSITSHGYGAGYRAEFEWTGTRDSTAWLCFGAGTAAHRDFGG